MIDNLIDLNVDPVELEGHEDEDDSSEDLDTMIV